MAKYSSRAALAMAKFHANELKETSKYLEVCKRDGDKQGVKDFSRLLLEHGAAWARYSLMATTIYRHNLEVYVPFFEKTK